MGSSLFILRKLKASGERVIEPWIKMQFFYFSGRSAKKGWRKGRVDRRLIMHVIFFLKER